MRWLIYALRGMSLRPGLVWLSILPGRLEYWRPYQQVLEDGLAQEEEKEMNVD
jgi:hypothetical protein